MNLDKIKNKKKIIIFLDKYINRDFQKITTKHIRNIIFPYYLMNLNFGIIIEKKMKKLNVNKENYFLVIKNIQNEIYFTKQLFHPLKVETRVKNFLPETK